MARGAARAARGREGTDAAQRRAGAAAPGTALGARRQGVSLRHRRGQRVARRICSTAARSCSSITSCSGRTTRPAARPARRSPTASTASRVHLANHDVMLWAVSRAPLAKLQAYKQRMGWTLSLGVVGRRRLQLRLQRLVHRGAAARRRHRIQLPPRRATRWPRRRCRRWPSSRSPRRCGTDAATYRARAAGHERLRARGRRRLSHLFDLRARPRRAVGHVSVARPRAARAATRQGVWWRHHDSTAGARNDRRAHR